jgi:branched-chain amino acid transport system ATP-binding protein
MHFGGTVALDTMSLTVRAGEICGLIGPNDAGKTTLLNTVSCIYEPTSGSITLGTATFDTVRPVGCSTTMATVTAGALARRP